MPAVTAPPRVTYTDSHTRASRRIGSDAEMEELRHYVELIGSLRPAVVPAGWKPLGEGVSRQALLSPAGWVWKVPLGRLGSEASKREDVYWRMALKHPEFRPHVPHYRVFTPGDHVLIAMELLAMNRGEVLKPSTPETREAILNVRAMAAHIGCDDFHGGNVGWRGDRHPVLLDAGAGSNGRVGQHDGCGTCNEKHYTRKDMP